MPSQNPIQIIIKYELEITEMKENEGLFDTGELVWAFKNFFNNQEYHINRIEQLIKRWEREDEQIMKVIYKKKVWIVRCPKDLIFPPLIKQIWDKIDPEHRNGVIQNVLIQYGKERVITPRSELKIFKNHQINKWM